MIAGKAGNLDLALYRGARFAQRLEFFLDATDEPFDLSDMGPWTCEVTENSGELVLAIAVDATEAADGALELSAEPEDTDALAVGVTRSWGLQSANGEYVLDGKAFFYRKAPR